MLALEKLFRLEIEFHRRLRTAVPGTVHAGSLHTSFALQTGYELLLGAAGSVTDGDVETLHRRLLLTADPRDILAARASIKQLFGIALVRD